MIKVKYLVVMNSIGGLYVPARRCADQSRRNECVDISKVTLGDIGRGIERWHPYRDKRHQPCRQFRLAMTGEHKNGRRVEVLLRPLLDWLP